MSFLGKDTNAQNIYLLAFTVQNQLINDIKRNKYYGLLFDSTPDISHREQMSQVVTYVAVDFINKKVSIKEFFLGFIGIHAKDAASIENTILEKLSSDEISLTNWLHIWRSAKNNRKKKYKALFVNCDNHSLNLVGVTAAK